MIEEEKQPEAGQTSTNWVEASVAQGWTECSKHFLNMLMARTKTSKPTFLDDF